MTMHAPFRFSRFCLLVLCCGMCSCLLPFKQKQSKKAPEPIQSPVYVGKVAQVYPQYNYALIMVNGNIYPPETILISQSPPSSPVRRVANLKISEERLGNIHLPADIQSGAVAPGDLVFLYQHLSAPEPTDNTQPAINPAPNTPDAAPGQDNPDDTPAIAPSVPQPPAAPAPDPAAEQERKDRERENIMKELENTPARRP